MMTRKVLLILISLMVCLISAPVYAWVGNYTYRVPITITSPQGMTIPRYQFNITISNGTFPNSTGLISLGGTVRPDFNDTQFTTSTDVNLSFVATNKTNVGYGSNATFWFNTWDVANGDNIVYLYWNNTNQINWPVTHNGQCTFLFFDHFDTQTINKSLDTVTGSAGNYSQINSFAEAGNHSTWQTYRLRNGGNFTWNVSVQFFNTRFGLYLLPLALSPVAGLKGSDLSSNNTVLASEFQTPSQMSFDNYNKTHAIFYIENDYDRRDWEITRNFTKSTHLWKGHSLLTSNYNLSDIPTIRESLWFGNSDGATNTSVDGVFVRNFSWPEPYISGLGKEETLSVNSYFIGIPISGITPYIVQFTSSDVVLTDTYLWNFGDGETSTSKNPTHTYMTALGSPYTVTLTVTHPLYGTNTTTRTNYITVIAPYSTVTPAPTPTATPAFYTTQQPPMRVDWNPATGVYTHYWWDTSGPPNPVNMFYSFLLPLLGIFGPMLYFILWGAFVAATYLYSQDITLPLVIGVLTGSLMSAAMTAPESQIMMILVMVFAAAGVLTKVLLARQ